MAKHILMTSASHHWAASLLRDSQQLGPLGSHLCPTQLRLNLSSLGLDLQPGNQRPSRTSRHRDCSIHATFCVAHLPVPGSTVNPGPKSMPRISGQGKPSVVVLTSFVVSHYVIGRFQGKVGTDIGCIIVVIVYKKSLKLKKKVSSLKIVVSLHQRACDYKDNQENGKSTEKSTPNEFAY